MGSVTAVLLLHGRLDKQNVMLQAGWLRIERVLILDGKTNLVNLCLPRK